MLVFGFKWNIVNWRFLILCVFGAKQVRIYIFKSFFLRIFCFYIRDTKVISHLVKFIVLTWRFSVARNWFLSFLILRWWFELKKYEDDYLNIVSKVLSKFKIFEFFEFCFYFILWFYDFLCNKSTWFIFLSLQHNLFLIVLSVKVFTNRLSFLYHSKQSAKMFCF